MTVKDLYSRTTTTCCKYNEGLASDPAASCLETYNDGCGYIGFIGGVEVPNSKLSESVPVGFYNSTKLVGEEEVQKTWDEYVLTTQGDNGKSLIHYLHVWINGNRHDLTEEIECQEWRRWYEHFGVDLMYYPAFNTRRNSKEYKPIVII